MSGQGSLTGLCAVCCIEPPKYKCPRCKTQTCSLACYKTHQERASCNGQRNPAAFVKKSQWATPAGIDHDYNYLKSVERHIDEAADTHAKDGNQRHRERQWASDSTLQKYLREHRIDVVRAPTGMSRATANKTRVSGRGFVLWTVEWLDNDGHIEIDESCPATSSLYELYSVLSARRAKAERKQSQHVEPARKKRRIGNVEEEVEQVGVRPSASGAVDGSTVDINAKSKDIAAQLPGESVAADNDSCEDRGSTIATTVPTPTANQFYLLKAGSGSNVKVVIPLTSTDSLTSALAGQTIQEYPTILVLPYTAAQLPSQFKTEAVFLQELHQDAGTTTTSSARTTASQSTPKLPDAAKIIEMLRRDTRTT